MEASSKGVSAERAAGASGASRRGPTLAGSFLVAGLIDQVVAYRPSPDRRWRQAGAGRARRPNIADAKRFLLEDVVRIGPDVRLPATPLK